MSTDERKRVHFLGPEHLIEKADAFADVLDKDRTDVIVEALREYLTDQTVDDRFEHLVADAYFDDRLEVETVRVLLDGVNARRLQVLKHDLEDAPLDLAEPDRDVDIYGEGAPTGDRDGE